MNQKKAISLILVLALILRIIFIFAVPVFEKPDEKSHFEYIKFVAENNRLPVQQKGQFGAEYFQPPLYHVLASFILKIVDSFTDELWYQVVIMRFLSVLVSMLTIYMAYKIASLIFKDGRLILGITIFVSFLPSHINMNSAITNANFADFLSTLIFYLLLKVSIKEKIEDKMLYVLGVVCGIALITRLSVVPVIVLIPFVFLVKYYLNLKKLVKPLLIIGLIALLISGWNFVRNFNLYGDFLGYNAMKLAAPLDDKDISFVWVARLLGWTFVSFWASFGRTNGVFIGNLNTSIGILAFFLFYSLLLAISLISIYGICRYIFRKYEELDKIQKNAFKLFSMQSLILVIFFVRFSSYNFQPQGRLLFPAIAGIATFFTYGIYKIISQKYKSKFLASYILFFITIDILSIISVISFRF